MSTMQFVLMITWNVLSIVVAKGINKDSTQPFCPKQCECRTRSLGVDVNCGSRGLTHIPDRFPHHTSTISLTRNRITSVRADAFKGCTNLMVLDLSRNEIADLNEHAFRDLKQLQILHLNLNKLNMTEQSLPPNLFKSLGNLLQLHISHNIWNNASIYRDDLMLPLIKLKKLFMDGVPSQDNWGSGFSHLSSLEELIVYGGLDYISNITLTVFQSSPLSTIMIKDTILQDLEPMAFANLTRLRTLVFSNNPHISLMNMRKSFIGLRYTKIDRLVIDACGYMVLESVIWTDDFLSDLQFTNITKFFLFRNNIGLFECSFSANLPKLETLSIQKFWNAYEIFKIFQEIGNLSKLKFLSLTGPRNLDHIGNFHTEVNSFNSVVLSNEDFKPYPSDMLFQDKPVNSEKMTCRLPQNIKHIIIRFPIQDYLISFPTIVLEGTNSLENLEIMVTKYLYGEIIIHKPKQTVRFYIHLVDGKMEYLNPKFLKASIDNGLLLEKLDLSGNSLQKQLLEGDLLKHFPMIKFLNLNSNDIAHLNKDTFSSQKNLEHLYLISNFLRFVSFDISNNPLKYLDLSKNSIPFLSSRTIEQIDRINKSGLFTLSMHANPLQCSCESLDFIQWLLKTNYLLTVEDYTCFHFKRGHIPISSMNSTLLHELHRKCSTKTFLIAAASCFGGILFTIAISAFAHKHRWDIKFFFLDLVSRRKRQKDIEDELTSYRYDAFVAYHADSIAWIKNELLPNLEEPNNELHFNLCVHHRDFMPGLAITDNIIESIKNSKKTILILTPQFVESSWRDFEVQIARMRCFDEGRDLIIVIMLEEVPAAKMTYDLRALIRQVTYLEWPKQSTQEKAFWGKLKESLRKRDTKRPSCNCGKTVYRE